MARSNSSDIIDIPRRRPPENFFQQRQKFRKNATKTYTYPL
jgi:hypothetical protein